MSIEKRMDAVNRARRRLAEIEADYRGFIDAGNNRWSDEGCRRGTNVSWAREQVEVAERNLKAAEATVVAADAADAAAFSVQA